MGWCMADQDKVLVHRSGPLSGAKAIRLLIVLPLVLFVLSILCIFKPSAIPENITSPRERDGETVVADL